MKQALTFSSQPLQDARTRFTVQWTKDRFHRDLPTVRIETLWDHDARGIGGTAHELAARVALAMPENVDWRVEAFVYHEDLAWVTIHLSNVPATERDRALGVLHAVLEARESPASSGGSPAL